MFEKYNIIFDLICQSIFYFIIIHLFLIFIFEDKKLEQRKYRQVSTVLSTKIDKVPFFINQKKNPNS